MEQRANSAKMKNRSPMKMKLRSSITSKCSVFSCRNTLKETQNIRPTLEYFPFPKNKVVLELWKKFCEFEKVENDCDDYFVCADHFAPSDFIEPLDKVSGKRGGDILKSDAVPSIYKPELKSGRPSNETINIPIEGEIDIDKNTSKSSTMERNKVHSRTSQAAMKPSATHAKKPIPKNVPNHHGPRSFVNQKFINLLKEHADILETSLAASVRFRKTRALKKLSYAYGKRFGKQITTHKLRKKIENMMAYIREKLIKMKNNPDTPPSLNKSEVDFLKLLESKTVPVTATGHERREDTSPAILSYNHDIPRNISTSLMECVKRNSDLSAETEETDSLSNGQLHRLLTLEQLKLIRLQQLQSQREIERLQDNYRTT